MRPLCTSAVVVFLAFATASAQADGLIYKLPEDGTWALFKMEGYEERSGEKEPITGHLQIASVGTTTVDDQKCRWIEFELVYKKVDRPERKRVTKMLIPEKYLTKGQAPAEHILRGWVAGGDLKQRRIADRRGKPNVGEMLFFLLGPSENAHDLEPEEVDSGLGKLKCHGLRGSYNLEIPHQEGPIELPIEFELRLHEKAPFGVVSYEFTGEEPGGPFKTTLTLSDLGGTARSQLPNAN